MLGSLTNSQKFDDHKFYLEYQKKYGDTFIVWLGRTPKIYTNEIELVKKVLNV